MKEKWRWVNGFKGLYIVSSTGRVKSKDRVVRCKTRWGNYRNVLHKGRELKQNAAGKSGHLLVFLYKCGAGAGNSEARLVHRLVLEAFVGPCPEGMECRHLNDVSQDNRLENLCWGTRKEQAEDRKKNGNSHYNAAPKGEAQYNSKLTEEIVREIRRKYMARECTQIQMAKEYKVKLVTINAVVKRRNWKHVD